METKRRSLAGIAAPTDIALHIRRKYSVQIVKIVTEILHGSPRAARIAALFLLPVLLAVHAKADPVNQLLVWTAPWEEGEAPGGTDEGDPLGLVWLTTDVAFDSQTGLYENPKLGTTYGVYAPAGVSPVAWFATSDDTIGVPYGPGVVSPGIIEASILLDDVIAATYGDPIVPVIEDIPLDPVPEANSLLLLSIVLVSIVLWRAARVPHSGQHPRILQESFASPCPPTKEKRRCA